MPARTRHGGAVRVTSRGPHGTGFEHGTRGLFKQAGVKITAPVLARYVNLGGFVLLGRSADQVRTPEQVRACAMRGRARQCAHRCCCR